MNLRERTRLSRALNDIDVAIHSTLGSDEIMQAALDGFVAALGADAGDIKVRDGAEWVVRFEHGFGPATVGTRLSAADAPVAELVAAKREPCAITDYRAPEMAHFFVGFPRSHNLRAALAVPLIIKGDVSGCLFAWMRETARVFSPGEIDFARRMATSVALALENARLHEAEQRERQRAELAERHLERELVNTRALLQASAELSSTTDTDELLARLERVLMNATAIGRVFINFVDMQAQVLIPKIPAMGLVAPHGRVIPLHLLSETSRNALLSRRTMLLDYEREGLPDLDREIAKANSSRLVLFVPLIHDDELIGHISLDQPAERYEFSEGQIRVVEGIAAQASVALQNARLYEREHRIAETLQQAILSPPEHVPALDVSYLYQPASAAADVGGDFYDVLDLGDDRAAVLIGDIAGKGIDAARLTALMRDGTRAYLAETHDPEVVVARLNRLAYRYMPMEKFATVFLGVLDRTTGVFRYVAAGHPAPVLLKDGSASLLESSPGLIGAFADITLVSHTTVLDPGDVLTLVTDGVTEARAASGMFGDAGVERALEGLCDIPIAELPGALLAEVRAFAGGILRDDVVILCLSRTKPSATASPCET